MLGAGIFYFPEVICMLLDKFAAAAFATAQMCATVAGAACAVLAFCLMCFAFALLACAAFDRLTAWVAARWRRKKRRPAGRIARIILAHGDDGGV